MKNNKAKISSKKFNYFVILNYIPVILYSIKKKRKTMIKGNLTLFKLILLDCHPKLFKQIKTTNPFHF